jgi:uncharacterized coiled-coil DUF342 family protein
MSDSTSHQYRELHNLADEAEDAGDLAAAAELRAEATALSHAEAQRLQALDDTYAEIQDLTQRLQALSAAHSAATTLEELARLSVPARPMIERLRHLQGRVAILERSAA